VLNTIFLAENDFCVKFLIHPLIVLKYEFLHKTGLVSDILMSDLMEA